MKPKKAERIRDIVRSEIDMSKDALSFHTLTIRFDNRSVVVPYQPWAPRKDVVLPGRWVQEGDDDA